MTNRRQPDTFRRTILSARSALWRIRIIFTGLVLLAAGCSLGSEPVSYGDTALDQFRAAFDLPRPDGLPPFPQDGQYWVGIGASHARVLVRDACVERELMFYKRGNTFELDSEHVAVRGPSTCYDVDGVLFPETVNIRLINRNGVLQCDDYYTLGDTPKPRSLEDAIRLAHSWISQCKIAGSAPASRRAPGAESSR